MAMTAAWLEVLDISGVPPEQYEACYSAAVQARAERKAGGEQLSHLTADELAAEWIKIRRLNEEIERQSVKMLAAVNPRHCLRCYGTGKEEMADGTSRPGCAHLPVSDEEQAERTRLQKERIQFAREQARQRVGNPEPFIGPVMAVPRLVRLKCSKCPRTVDRLHYEAGQVCNDLLNRGQGDGNLKLCDGVLKSN
jgi:hypothetical protein